MPAGDLVTLCRLWGAWQLPPLGWATPLAYEVRAALLVVVAVRDTLGLAADAVEILVPHALAAVITAELPRVAAPELSRLLARRAVTLRGV